MFWRAELHAAHDVVEYSHLVDQIHAGSTLSGKPRSYFLLDLQKAIDNMGFVERKAMKFEARCGIKAEQITYSPPTSLQPLTSWKNCMVGFDAVLVRLMEMLTGEDSSRLVIPIVGMGGMGKTTLARNAYDHLLSQQAESCGIHDIVREFCLKVGKKEKFVCVLDTTQALLRERRIAIPSGKRNSDIDNALESAPLLRSLLRPVCSWSEKTLSVQLRDSEKRSLPWSISLCWNLQTIDMRDYYMASIRAPQEIWEMAQLRHIEFYQIFLPELLPGDRQECIILRNLQIHVRVTDFRLTEEVRLQSWSLQQTGISELTYV